MFTRNSFWMILIFNSYIVFAFVWALIFVYIATPLIFQICDAAIESMPALELFLRSMMTVVLIAVPIALKKKARLSIAPILQKYDSPFNTQMLLDTLLAVIVAVVIIDLFFLGPNLYTHFMLSHISNLQFDKDALDSCWIKSLVTTH